MFNKLIESYDRRSRLDRLRRFNCPFREDGGVCRQEPIPQRCRFGHPETAPDGRPHLLRDLPYFICFHHLLGECYVETYELDTIGRDINGNNRSSVEESDVEDYARDRPEDATGRAIMNPEIIRNYCESGLHLDLEELDNLDRFEESNAELFRHLYGSDIDLECVICCEKVLMKRFTRNRRFGIMEECDHIFCRYCLTGWYRNSHRCPICDVPSKRFISNEKFIPSTSLPPSMTKSQLFSRLPFQQSMLGNSRIRLYGSELYIREVQESCDEIRDICHWYLKQNLKDQQIDRELCCTLCSKPILQGQLLFGILENCYHVFCDHCIRESGKFGQNGRCPSCNERSFRYAISARHTITGCGCLKRYIFNERPITRFLQFQATVYRFEEVEL